MKKIIMLILVVLASMAAVNAQNWAKVSMAPEGLSSVLVRANGQVLAFGQHCYSSANQGVTWSQISTLPGQVAEALEFNGLVYIAADNGLYSSLNGISWLSVFPEKITMCSNSQHVFAFGAENFYRLDNGVWNSIGSLSGIIGSAYETFVTAATADDNRLVIYADHAGPGYFVPMESTDNGQNWTTLSNFYWDYINDASMSPAGYEDAVGGRGQNLSLSSVGAMPFNYPTGQLLTCLNIADKWWMGGYVGICPQSGCRGILMADGDLSTIVFTDGVIQEIASGTGLAIAVDDLGGVYTMPVMVTTSYSDLPESPPALKVFPNPAENEVCVELSAGSWVDLLSIDGRLLKSEFLLAGSTTLNIAKYPPGLIIIQAGNKMAKVIKR